MLISSESTDRIARPTKGAQYYRLMNKYIETKGVIMNIKPTSNQAATQNTTSTRPPQNDNIKDNAVPNSQPQESPKVKAKDTILVSSTGKQALQGVQNTKTQASREAQGDNIEAKKRVTKETTEKAISQKAATPPANDVDKLLR
jgi:hypothetical protein